MRTQRADFRRAKPLPILEMDEFFDEPQAVHEGRAWSSDGEEVSLQLADFPTEFDD